VLLGNGFEGFVADHAAALSVLGTALPQGDIHRQQPSDVSALNALELPKQPTINKEMANRTLINMLPCADCALFPSRSGRA